MAAPRCFYVPEALPQQGPFTPPKEMLRRWQKVLRLAPQTPLSLFNEGACVFGTWDGQQVIVARVEEIPTPQPVTLFIGLPKKDAMDRVLRQATELHVAAIQPVFCKFSVPDKLNLERARNVIVEAAEQCERKSLPALLDPKPFPQALQNWDAPLCWAYERGDSHAPTPPAGPYGLMIGPEGGFSPEEITALNQHPQTIPFTLGKTILRTDTAVVAGLGRLIG